MQEEPSPIIETIQKRRSCRQFLPTELSTEHEKHIKESLLHMEIPFDHKVSMTYHIVPNEKNIVYFQGPKQFIALASDRSPIEQAKLGFIGECAILQSEIIGVRTCWMGHYKAKEVQDIVYGTTKPLDDSILFCIILLGYVPEKTGFLDRFSQKRMSKKNKTIESFLHKESLTEFPEYIRTSLELASRAPSAMNSQKWYYLVERTDDGYFIELSKPKGYQHFKWSYYDIDVGTAAAHIWLGLKASRVSNVVNIIDREGDAVWRFLCKD